MTALRKAKGKLSCWVRNCKREFIYSPALRNWEKAVADSNPDDIAEYAERHARMFGYYVKPVKE